MIFSVGLFFSCFVFHDGFGLQYVNNHPTNITKIILSLWIFEGLKKSAVHRDIAVEPSLNKKVVTTGQKNRTGL
jgi:hypothetical protein